MLGLPPYCAGRFARHTNAAEYRQWETRYGPDFLHTHHLCDAIIALNKIPRAKNAMEKNVLIKNAMGDLNYMIQHAKPDFGLMPEVYLHRSRVYASMDRRGEAVADLLKAVELNPKAPGIYLQGAAYLESIGHKAEALKLVAEGLRHLPESQPLQKAYSRLGGKEPYQEPLEKPQQQTQAKTDPIDTTSAEPKLAVFDLSRLLAGGGNVWREAGAHYFVELTEHPKDPAGMLQIRLVSMVPQPATRVARIGIDMGRHQGLFSDIQVEDPLFGKYYPLKRADGLFTHALWQGFRPTYLAAFTIDPKEAKMYDPKALPPGNRLTMIATLAPGARFEDVIDAMREGLHSPSGVRFGIIAHHTRGYRPEPRQTIMDDGGFVTGSLRRATGLKARENEPAIKQIESQPKTPEVVTTKPETLIVAGARKVDPSAVADQGAAPSRSTSGSEPRADPGRNESSKNPWCRFCPAE